MNSPKEWLERATEILRDGGVPSPRWDAEILLGQVLGCRRGDLSFLLRRWRAEVRKVGDRQVGDRTGGLATGEEREDTVWNSRVAERYWALVQRRAAREPLQHLCGSWDFMGLELAVDRRALIPRPETEVLVETVVRRLKEMAAEKSADSAGGPPLAADVGTGTGAIALALAHFCPEFRILGTDISADALDLASANALHLGLSERVEFAMGDLLKPVEAWLGRRRQAAHSAGPSGTRLPGEAAGLVALVSNPPYIPTADVASLQPEVALHDPRVALDGGADGLDFYRRLIPRALALLRQGDGKSPATAEREGHSRRGGDRLGGLCAVEVGSGQAPEVAALFRQAGYNNISVTKDLSGVDRVVLGHRA